ncbi:MAG TPA: AMP-binding protein [Bryobacteraceae bacterium]|nr:AMP-binding protein [Bryobacteraceae bacterium]
MVTTVEKPTSADMLSCAAGPDIPFIEKTIPEVLAETASRLPNANAVVSRHQGLRLSWRELQERCDETARGLWGMGIRPNDRVGMWSTSCVEWIYLQVALAKIGAVLVNLNPAYRAVELRYVLQRSRMKALFLRERDRRADYSAIIEEARRGQEIALEHTVLLDDPQWNEMLAAGVEPEYVPTTPEDVVNIQYTSGTTGRPKGVLLTHRNLLNDGNLIGKRLKAAEDDRICAPVPLYHCFGCVIGVMVCMTSGAALVMPAPQFDALATLQAVHEERCTALYGVPTMFIAEFEHPRFHEFDMSSIRKGVMSGAPCPIELMKRVVNEMHCRELTICYGQTESSPVITMSATDDSLETRVTTIGRPLGNTEVKIVDPLTGVTVPVGFQGELCTRGFLVMKGYDGDPEATAKVIDEEGWLHTGDLAMMREDGYFRITGRAKDMISRGGEKIYPREVEEFLHTHPKIADVHVVGIPDARLGEIVAAWIKLKTGCTATTEEIRDFCRGEIAYFKTPQHIRFVDSFPITANGKVQKYLMRDHEIRTLGLEHIASAATA